ncbi:hypothetical protein BMF77_01037 [Dolichospermum sp. UHCC 0315A]|jgi:hypothetical protein|uniref:hypothetical protein n=1 Tax=Dolichospermum sp. UHCC 0315A TaxID=1914871 RepID=UPI0011E6A70A|nr:hypothetical protein [Dolichospermum sp. UHCC 0315A]MBO1053151.1 hypothetical protein [Dolichospermum sp. DET73]QEI40468.1 hypothetical protein BMF77_01037 [Dolichospermum sp. UHCC 0315A]
MFQLLSRVLLWLLFGVVAFALFQRFYPSVTFVGKFLLGLVIVVLVLAFFNPSQPTVASLWRFISFPLKPLGASVLMLFLAAQKIKGGGIDKPGGFLLGWALTVLLLSSTPAITYLLGSPVATVEGMNLNQQTASSTLVALSPANANFTISDIQQNIIPPMGEINRTTIAFNGLNTNIPSYLLQNPQETQGLRVEDFVPNAKTLQRTTEIWERYLQDIYDFILGRK